jgi:FAD/FMN-containing dehydrogenase
MQLELKAEPELTADVGPGITNALLGAGLKKNAPKDVFAVQGQCPSVGIAGECSYLPTGIGNTAVREVDCRDLGTFQQSAHGADMAILGVPHVVSGFLLGGGQALTSTSHGLACDSVISLEMVLYNGTVIRANRTQHSDVLWATCGGSGGFGIVTEFEVQLHRMPSKVVTVFTVPFKEGAEIDYQLKFQEWWATGDARLAGGGGTANIVVRGTGMGYARSWYLSSAQPG